MRQLFREFVIHRRKREEEADRDLVLAWHTAALTRAKKLPDIRDLLKQRRRKLVKQTRSEAKASFYQMAARLGVKPKKTRLIQVDTQKHG